MKKWYLIGHYTQNDLVVVLQTLTDQGILSEDMKIICSSKSCGSYYYKILYLSEKEIEISLSSSLSL